MLELYFIVGRCSELEIVLGQLRTGKGGGVEVEAAMSYLYIDRDLILKLVLQVNYGLAASNESVS